MANDKAGGQATPEPAAKTPATTEGAAAATTATLGKDGKTPEVPAKAATTEAGGTTATDAGGKDGAAKPEPKVPDTYALTVPEGAEAFIDDGVIGEISTVAKANQWTNEQAQAALENIADQAVERAERYRMETVNDPIYGGDHLEQTQQHAERALDRMWPKGSKDAQAFRRLLTSSGYGNHRLILGGLANIGKLMAEDGPTGGKTASASARSAADVLYGEKSTPS